MYMRTFSGGLITMPFKLSQDADNTTIVRKDAELATFFLIFL